MKQSKRNRILTGALAVLLAGVLGIAGPLYAAPRAFAEQGLLDGGVTNPTGYPITNEPITLKGVVLYSSLRPDMDTTRVWDYVFEKTNIRVEWEIVKDKDKIALMFASMDFPDIAANIGVSDLQLQDAAEGGSLVALNGYIDQYAPTWKAFFGANPQTIKTAALPDGNLYTLPFIDFDPQDREIRDEWFINNDWLTQLNLPVPTTTTELFDTLKAFKENAGTGAIPENVIPYTYRFEQWVGGQFDIYAAFGLYTSDNNYMYVDDNGVVSYQAVNPDIKEPLKYLRDMYLAGLTPPEIFTDDFATYLSKESSYPGIVGFWSEYSNKNPKQAIAMAPVSSPNGKAPVVRTQNYTGGPAHAFMMFSSNKYPVATIRLCEAITEAEMGTTVNRGLENVFWKYDSDGRIVDLMWESQPTEMAAASKELGMWNSFLALRDQNYHANYYHNTDYDTEGTRAWAYENIYKPYATMGSHNYYAGMLERADAELLSQYTADLKQLRATTFANWITGKGDIDAEWDAYVRQSYAVGLAEFLALKQKAYDIAFK